MGKAKGMTPREILAEMVLRGVKQVDIAKEVGVTPGFIHQVIYSIGRNKGYRVRAYIASAIDKSVEEIWPDDTTQNSSEACKRVCL